MEYVQDIRRKILYFAYDLEIIFPQNSPSIALQIYLVQIHNTHPRTYLEVASRQFHLP